MLHYPNISPEIFSIGIFSIRWYGVMYLIGLLVAWLLGRRRLRGQHLVTAQVFDDTLVLGMLGAVLGGRIGYVLFYQPAYFMAHPSYIFMLWEGGMSFHGGLLGVIITLFYCERRFRLPYFALIDFVAPLVPPGLFFGRIGNFLNAELWGRVTDVPWAMVFPGAGSLPRHPSQLYEAFLEGVVLFAIVWWYSSTPRPVKAVSGMFALCYGILRFCVEFVREPDAHLGFLAGNYLTMGMLLSLPLVLVGCILLYCAYGGAAKRVAH